MASLDKRVPLTIGAVVFDACLSETHASEAEVTEHPVESGGNVADHVRPKAETLKIEGLITDGPLKEIPQGGTFVVTEGRAKEELEKLRRMKDTGEMVTVVTALREYPNMVVTALDVPRDTKMSDAVRCTVSLKQIRTVELQTVTLRKEPRPLVLIGVLKKNKGTKVPAPAPKRVAIYKRLTTPEGRAALAQEYGLPIKWGP